MEKSNFKIYYNIDNQGKFQCVQLKLANVHVFVYLCASLELLHKKIKIVNLLIKKYIYI